ncbi:MAG: hypothetical protein RIS70_1062 [Planctomycetota bacterium]
MNRVLLSLMLIVPLSAMAYAPRAMCDDSAANHPQSNDDRKKIEQKQLLVLQSFVGAWKGVGQVRRGSRDGAWSEQGEWAWKFTPQGVSLNWTATSGRFFESGVMRAVADREFEWTAKPVAKQGTNDGDANAQDSIVYRGRLSDEGQLTLSSQTVPDGLPDRVTIRSVAGGDRLVVLYERRQGDSDRYSRLGEWGGTRIGSGFGQGGGGPECVVTGGYGSMKIVHDGETYYLCCSGCREVFLENPKQVLADYRAKKALEKQKRSQKN